MKEKKFPHTRKPLHGRRWWVGGGEALEPRRRAQQQGFRGKAEISPNRGSLPTSTHHPERLVCSPDGAGGGKELRLGLRSSDPRERTGVDCLNTA